MTTALITYGTNTAASTLSTACTLIANTTGGSPLGATTKVGTSTGFGEVWSQGNTATWAAGGAIGTPTGHGYLLDATTLEGQQIIAGTWTPQVRMLVSNGSITATIIVRAYKRSSGGVYTQIGSNMTLAGQSITTTVATYTFAGSALPVVAFTTGDKLYIDVWLNITANSSGSSLATVTHNASNSSSQGAINNAQTTTPGYQVAQVTDTVGLRTRVSTRSTRSSGLRTRVRSQHTVSTGLRTRVVGMATRVSTLRAPVRTQHTPTTGIRLLVRSTHMAVTIGGILVSFDEDTWKLSPRLDDIWHFQATILDYTGTLTFPYESQVIVYDDTRGTLFTGLLIDDKMDKSNTYPDTTIEHQIDCIDNRRRVSKRTTSRLYTAPFYAGKAVVDMANDTLAAEGVIANAVTAVTTTTADWAAGTLTNVVAAATTGDGDLELASSASLGASYLTQASWNSGTLASLETNSDNTLSLIGVMRNWNNGKTTNQTLFGIADTSEKASITQGVTSSGYFYLTCPQSDASVSRQDYAGTWANGTFETDMKLEKDGLIYSLSYRTTNWNNTDNTYAYAVNLTTNQIVLNRGPNGGNSSTAWTTIASRTFSNKLCTGWYRVRVVVSGSSHTVYLNGTQRLTATDGTYTAAGYLGLRNRNTQTTGSAKDLFDNFGVLTALSGTWTSGSTSLAGVSSVTTSSISWDASLSTGGSVLVQVSLDGGTTWAACSNGGIIPGLAPGASGTGKNLVLKVTLSTTSTVLLPKIRSLVWSVVGGYTATGTWVSPPLALAPVGRAGATFISWNATLPTAATTLEVDISYDGGLTWTDVSAQNNGPLPGIFVQPDPIVDGFSSDTSLNYLYPQAAALASFLYDLPNSRLVATGGSGAMFLNSTIQNADVDLFCDLDWADTGGLVWDFININNYYLLTITDNQASVPSLLTLYKASANLPWYDPNYQFKKSISIDHTKVSGGADLSNFPLLIAVTDATLKTVGSGGSVQNASGFDIIFTDSTQTTKLDHEIERYTASSGEIEMWVRIPTLSASVDTVIYCYYSNTTITTSQENKTGVWDTNYKRVYHLGNGTTLSVADSTANAQNGTNNGATATTGQIDGGANFSGSSQYVAVPTTGLPSGAAAWSLSAWVKTPAVLPTGGTGVFEVVSFGGTAVANQLAEIYYFSSTKQFFGDANGTFFTGSATVTASTTYHLVLTCTGTVLTFYVNGVAIGSATTTPNITLVAADIGANVSSDNVTIHNFFSGVIDETRISSIARTAGWTVTEYNNQHVPSTFLTLGAATAEGSTTTQLGQASVTFTRGMHHRLRASIASGVITCMLSGIPLITYTDTSPLAAGLMGLYQSGNMSRYSELWLQPLGDDLTSVTLLTQQILATTDSSVSPQVTDLTIAAFGPNIDLGTLIPSADYRQKFIDKAYDDLAKQSNYSWFIDPAFLLHFHHRQAYPAPWILQSNTLGLASSLEVDTNLLVENASDLYRNRQTLTGVTFTGLFQNTFSGDTKRTSFTLSFPVAPGTIPTLTLNSVAQSVGKKGTTGAQWYYAEGDLTIAQDSSGTTLLSTDTLIVSYTGTYTDKLVVDNTVAQAALAPVSGGSGIVEAVEDVSQRSMTSDAALVYAQQLLARYCVVDANNLPTGRTLTFKAYRDGLQVGQALTVFVPEEHLVDVELLITAIDITMQTQPGGVALYGYVVTATELPVIARWAKLLASGLFD